MSRKGTQKAQKITGPPFVLFAFFCGSFCVENIPIAILSDREKWVLNAAKRCVHGEGVPGDVNPTTMAAFFVGTL